MTVYTLFLYIGIAAFTFWTILGVGHSKRKQHSVMHPMKWYVQYFMGSTLVFSGIVKAIDPLGTTYKMQDYFSEFQAQGLPFMDTMHENALVFSLVMLVLEVVLGCCLILGMGESRTTRLTFLMILFFTLLTGFNYLTGYTSKPNEIGILEFAKWEAFSDTNIRITDCGCFGDFLKLKPIETFCKDILLLIIAFYLMLNTSNLKELIPQEKYIGSLKLRTSISLLLIAASSWFCFQNYYFDKPMVDFRPFAEGLDLRKAKEDCTADVAITETYFSYINKDTKEEKIVNQHEFMKSKYLWEDKDAMGNTIWKVQNDKIRNKIIHEGCNSQIQYFEFPEILEENDYNFLVLSGDLTKTDKKAYKKISSLASTAEKDGIKTRAFYYFVGKKGIEAFRHEVNGTYEFMTADDKLIKTIIRANPGLLLLKDGKVIQKWHHNHIPEYTTVKQDFMLD